MISCFLVIFGYFFENLFRTYVGIAFKVWLAGIVMKRCVLSRKPGTASGP